MAVFNEPNQWEHPLGNNADASTLPDDATATAGIASLQKLFQIINATPLEAGGIAPDREDVNALFKYLGDQIFYTQNGGIPSYNAAYDYIPGRVVRYTDNNLYKCIQANGASSTVVAPGTDDTYWQQLDGENTSTSLIPNQIITSPVPLTDANLHLLDGALLSGSGAYSAYVAMMGELYTADPTATCWTDEATWQSTVSTYGECGKFVYDSVNNTLRLPKLKSFIQATTTANELGSLVEAGAPNITGEASIGRTGFSWQVENTNGALYNGQSVTGLYEEDSSSFSQSSLSLDASRSNPIYGNSNTIQPQAIKYYFYIVVGTVSKTDIQIDIDNVMTDLALKADTDLSNVPSSKGILVESYQNGSSWYRVYSDGWCEQGGEQSVQSGVSPATVTLLKPYINTNYSLLCTVNGYSSAWVAGHDKTTTNFKWSTVSNEGLGYLYSGSWYACGYIS